MRNKLSKTIFRNTLFKKATIQKFRYSLYLKDYCIIDLDLGKNKSQINVTWFEFRICGIGIEVYKNEDGFGFGNIYNRYWC